ncbi:MAG: indole-3-glycerol phosphate synthase TrpC [Solirubrobacterales bacterium]|nr:indole-3-glycerol phosphate synthase TrpC [Solirubrobacterales bacterium]
MSATILERILAGTREELERRRRAVPLAALEAQGAAGRDGGRARGALFDALCAPGIGVIAEFKRRSPSAGPLREGADPAAMVAAYERAGARAVSVLTEGPHFGGSLEDLRAARAACALPLLRKDFIVDRYQLHEARAAGADAVLLIVAALSREALGELHSEAARLGLDALVEVHDREELARALEVDAQLVGVNNRDLRDFTVDVSRTTELLGAIPDEVPVVSESGIAHPAQIAELGRAGVAAVLIGESLMRAPDPEEALRALLAGAGATYENF